MNIKQAKHEIFNTLKAYLAKDEQGQYLIPSSRQRPVLLMGPPGIGKTQIMAQIAAETGLGLVAYTITHHTRQSAVGLPFIEKQVFNGTEYTVTAYTMSEILAAVYSLMERTGIREGLLFLDEINCVSETLAPMMLQFLQNKTFGNQRLPEGWVIVAAGNPPEYNKSVRDFDVVTLDRVKRIDVREDYTVWKEYASRQALHGAILAYLDIKNDHFYRIETGVDGMEFATARGWEDLSELLLVYEKLGIKPDKEVVGQYIQLPRIARDFANYLALFYQYQNIYQVQAILSGEWQAVAVSQLKAAPFDEKLAVMGLLLSKLTEAAGLVRAQDSLTQLLHTELLTLKAQLAAGENAIDSLQTIEQRRRDEMNRAITAGQMDKETRMSTLKLLDCLNVYRQRLVLEKSTDAMDAVRGYFQQEIDARQTAADAAGRQFDNAFAFLEQAFGQSQELVLFVTEITAGYNTSWFVEHFGCEAYFRHNKALMFNDTRRQLQSDIIAAMKD